MKKTIILLVMSVFSFSLIDAQSNIKLNPFGTWKFDAPYAPAGYTSGTIIVGKENDTLKASMCFTGIDNKIPGQKVVIRNDSIMFRVFVEGTDVNVFLKMEKDTAMSGKAVYNEGEVPLALIKTQALPKK